MEKMEEEHMPLVLQQLMEHADDILYNGEILFREIRTLQQQNEKMRAVLSEISNTAAEKNIIILAQNGLLS